MGDFILMGQGKKARKQAKKLEAVLAERDELRAKAAEPRVAEDISDEPMEPGACKSEESPKSYMDDKPDSVLCSMSDEDLEAVLKITRHEGCPGREAYLAEQSRRREAKMAGKATWQRVRTVEEKWKRIKNKVSKAQTAVREAENEVQKAKDEAERAVRAAECKAVEARKVLLELREEESKSEALFHETRAKEVERPSATKECEPLDGFLEKLHEYRKGFDHANETGRAGAMQILRESFEKLLISLVDVSSSSQQRADDQQDTLPAGHRPPGASHAVAILASEAESARAGIYRSAGTSSVAAAMAVEAAELRGRARKSARFSPYDDGSRKRSSSADV